MDETAGDADNSGSGSSGPAKVSAVPSATGNASTSSRTDRRVLRTRATLEQAFITLVAERGLDNVYVEDIAERADVAKATFYAHYANKEALLSAVFSRLVQELAERVPYEAGPWTVVRHTATTATYAHAAALGDLYRVCLADPRTRERYTDLFREHLEQNMRNRMAALGRDPRVPIQVLARAAAGAHVALLDAWLRGLIEGTPEELASLERDAVVFGAAWGQGLNHDELTRDYGIGD